MPAYSNKRKKRDNWLWQASTEWWGQKTDYNGLKSEIKGEEVVKVTAFFPQEAQFVYKKREIEKHRISDQRRYLFIIIMT